ncbi:MAG: GDP-mannose 4,6-dehydratase [Candidatus Omnitrophica bacterium]|nr:GDP-mannose 4,6-dehydratase [Candidatus Omnitrophota bacterium]
MKKALITGITGQDGSYLAELLLEKGYEVYGLVRRVAFEDQAHRMTRILHIKDNLDLVAGSVESFPSIYKIVQQVRPDEVYHLAAQSFVSYSFDDEFSTLQTNINGTHHILSACKDLNTPVRVYFAGSSEMFGQVREVPQKETTPFHPRSPYGVSKVTGFELTRNYREAYGMFTCNGILFNHESPRRGYEFVTRKITSSVINIKSGTQDTLLLGNLDAKRDWGFAGDYVKAMWLMLQQDTPDDYVVATGEAHTVREFAGLAFKYAGFDITWEGKGTDEKGIDTHTGKVVVEVDTQFFRPAEVNLLIGDYSKAKKILGWKPQVTFEGLVKMMVESDREAYGSS